MLQYLETHTTTLYIIAFTGVMIAMVFWEELAPRRRPVYSCRIRWLSNFGVFIVDALILHLLLPLTAFALSVKLAGLGWGLFNVIDLPVLPVIAVSILVLDGLHYLKHLVLHKVSLFWRFHRVHHTDVDYDFTTGIRFHPFETIVSALLTMGAIAALGIPPVAVVIFETALVAVTFIVHGNVRYPRAVDDVLRWLLVTPDMHRIHHSARQPETDSNYGVIFSGWDRLFGTHIARPLDGHAGMTLGLAEFREDRHQSLPWMLAGPFLEPERHAANTGHDDAVRRAQE